MLHRVWAIRFDRKLTSGRTCPSLMTCEDEGGEVAELVVKLAKNCDMGVRSLVAECVAAMLARDVDLPIPRPHLVFISSQFARTIPDAEVRASALESTGWNFGSLKLPPGFSSYPRDKPIPPSAVQTAAEILAFDIFIANADRRPDNPNLLLRGDNLAIFDHEMSFFMEGIIGWKRPWEQGGIPAQGHLLFNVLRGKILDFSRFENAVERITDARLNEYRQVLPIEWLEQPEHLERMLAHIRQLRDNIQEATRQLLGALQ